MKVLNSYELLQHQTKEVIDMVNPAAIMKLMGAKNKFEQAHPKFAAFFKTVLAQGINEGDVIEITVTKSNGTPITANMKVQQSDLELIEELKSLSKN